MGQFIDHDLAHSPNFGDRNCCTADGKSFNNGPKEKNCIAIKIPENDEFYSKHGGRRCMPMERALTSPNLNCEMGSREQVHD